MMVVNGELDRTWEEAVMASFDVVPCHFPRGTEKFHEILDLPSDKIQECYIAIFRMIQMLTR
jgi:hypothetical protein